MNMIAPARQRSLFPNERSIAANLGIFDDELVIDNFAGGGGASTGIAEALGRDPDVALNHDEIACAMYRANHPNTLVFCQSVFKADPLDVVREASRRRGSATDLPVGVAWYSPDCTTFSKAKNGIPIRNRASRDLAWVIPLWAERVAPRIILMENVEEWLGWTPLRQKCWPDGTPMADLHGMPVLEPDKSKVDENGHGATFKRWLRKMHRLGYAVEWRELRACDFGAPTIRNRLFLIARNDGEAITWPDATHADPMKSNLLLPWRTAGECFDWDLPVKSVYERRQLPVDNTMARIVAGAHKYVYRGLPFILPLTHQGDKRVHSVHEPSRTITTAPRGEFQICQATFVDANPRRKRKKVPSLLTAFVAQHNKDATARSAGQPLATITTRGTQIQLVTARLVPVEYDGAHVEEVKETLRKFGGPDWRDEDGIVNIDGNAMQIGDFGTRMFTAREFFRCQGFREDYEIDNGILADGSVIKLNKTQQVEKCGNSVSPVMSRALVLANYRKPSQRLAA